MSKASEIKNELPIIVRHTTHKRFLRTRLTHRILCRSSSSPKAHQADSVLERDAFLRCEFATNVASFIAQPLTLTFECNGSVISATPDIEVTYANGMTELLEVKYFDHYAKPKVREKCRRVRDQFKSMGVQYRVVTEKQIRRCPTMLKNMHRLLGYRLDDAAELPSLTLFKSNSEHCIADLAQKFGSDAVVFRLIAKGKLTCDLSKPLTLETLVRKARANDTIKFI